MPESKYIPISCTFHDRLEHWSVSKTTVEVIYLVDDKTTEVRAVISDVFARNGADYALLAPSDDRAAFMVRLDYILSVDGIPLTPHC
ncbi:MAG: hypothetical protein HOC28_05960 [Bacteroidetes Order II. Incertae sedis bacterium]|jgi:Rho-binding antiterminator|nr:hypothetical protein [Bacteroidetes Order II. bacterium]MBT4053347.1 hypothetical protein [Bacteroidetes Order II. bacterium]MBT4602660.1 hypothetical protein [Bacteroidetes Order II. bacterium]MBT5250018.1 hypothetical protein [Bacteroidetes Order II. bacterium]MBT6200568.1 hypothetical protein [Bacteroidetes Order II. bacterium]